uniref:CDC42 small effector 2 n=1 Tax=Podarcis muralis TaxID=64176 RepID=A0A670KBI9_PODMU
MSEFWLCFNCCIAEQPQPKRRRRIDRSMIGEPTNFVHTAHVGSGDLFSGMNSGKGLGPASTTIISHSQKSAEYMSACFVNLLGMVACWVPKTFFFNACSCRWMILLLIKKFCNGTRSC